MDDKIKKPAAGRDTGGVLTRDRAQTTASSRSLRRGSAAQMGVGGALRSVYDEAVGEAVPQEMLDLLGKLD